jgi:hypothetical protein
MKVFSARKTVPDFGHVKVSWQVAGARQDAYAKAHPVVVERDKPSAEKRRYLHPVLHNLPKRKDSPRVAPCLDSA